MCTTVGFKYNGGKVFGRTLELGMELDNKVLYVPKGKEDFIETKYEKYSSKYAVIGSGFFDIVSFGDGINEMGLMGSNNFFPGYASFSKELIGGKVNMNSSNTFDYLLSRCKDVAEVIDEAKNIIILDQVEEGGEMSTDAHYFFMDAEGSRVVLEPKDGRLIAYDNPYGVLTNSPRFDWHTTNLKNYINLKSDNIDEGEFNEVIVSKFGEGSGMLGIPGDFTPPSRFIRAAYFVSNTMKNLERETAILQAFRILSQFDIPKGAVVDSKGEHADEALYTSVMDTEKSGYFIKCHKNINIQAFYLDDYINGKEIKFINLEKRMNL